MPRVIVAACLSVANKPPQARRQVSPDGKVDRGMHACVAEIIAGRNAGMQGDVWFRTWQVADQRANGIAGSFDYGAVIYRLRIRGQVGLKDI